MKFEYNTLDYIKKIKKGNSYFHTFLENESLAAGILLLNPGQEDTQLPHDSDEIYYILDGNGYLKINKKEYKISSGMSYYVPKNIEHHFFGNTKQLVVLYFFGGQDS